MQTADMFTRYPHDTTDGGVCPCCGRPYDDEVDPTDAEYIADQYCQLVQHHVGARRIGRTWRKKFLPVFTELLQSFTKDDLLTFFDWLDDEGMESLKFGLLSLPTGRYQHPLLKNGPSYIARALAWKKRTGK